MGIVLPKALSTVRVRLQQLTISNLAADNPVVDPNGDPAAGREVVVLAPDQLGAWQVIGRTATDASGDYSITVPKMSPAVVVCIGHQGERSACLGAIWDGA